MSTRDDWYQDKYDPSGSGTVFVFNSFYDTLEKLGIRSSMVALPGEDLERYVGYAGQICRGGGKMYANFVEWDTRRYKRWQKMFKHISSPVKHRIRLVAGSVLAHDALFRCRVHDIGIGAGPGKVLSIAQAMLYDQMRVTTNHNKWKVQILDMSFRGVPPRELGCSLQ